MYIKLRSWLTKPKFSTMSLLLRIHTYKQNNDTMSLHTLKAITMLQYPPRICLVYHTTNHLFLATMETKTLSTHSKTSINQPRRPHAKTKKNDPINWTQYLYYRRKPLLATSIQFTSATRSARQQKTWHWAGTRV